MLTCASMVIGIMPGRRELELKSFIESSLNKEEITFLKPNNNERLTKAIEQSK